MSAVGWLKLTANTNWYQPVCQQSKSQDTQTLNRQDVHCSTHTRHFRRPTLFHCCRHMSMELYPTAYLHLKKSWRYISESEILYSVLLWNNHLPIRYQHRQSASTAYRLQARPAPTGRGLRLTCIPALICRFNGRHPRDPWNYMDHYSFTDPVGMEGWVGLVVWPITDALPTKWSHGNHGSRVAQGKSASYRPTS